MKLMSGTRRTSRLSSLHAPLFLLAGGTALTGCSSERPFDLPVPAEEQGIQLRSAHLGPGRAEPLIDPDLLAPALDQLRPDEAGHFLIHFTGEASLLRPQLAALGVRIDTYLPIDALLVTANGDQARALAARRTALGIDYLEPYHPAYKVAPEIADLNGSEGPVGLLVHLFPGTDITALSSRLEGLGLSIEGSGGWRFPRLGMRLDARRLVTLRETLVRMPEVYWLELRGNVRLLNDEAVPIVQSGSNSGADGYILSENGLHGEGQIVGYIDTGNDYDSCYFREEDGEPPVTNVNFGTAVDTTRRKIIAYDLLWSADNPSNPQAYDSHGHGSHVGGNIGGDNIATPVEHDSMDGVATAAQFVVQDGGYAVDDCADLPALGCPVVDLQPFFQQAYAQGARVHTNSWGDNENSSAQNNYSAGSEDVDAFMHDHPDFLLLFAAGNSGPDPESVGSPSTAKNCISVGGTNNGSGLDTVIGFSSRGPTTDNRIKPDLMAPASNTSANGDKDVSSGNCDQNSGAGTSYASPLVAGAAALVRQYYAQGYYPGGIPNADDAFQPSAALVKATLMNSGLSMKYAQPIPTFDQGWGRVALDTALPFPGDPEQLRLVDGSVYFYAATDASFTLQVPVSGSTAPLKVTLVWTDPPSTPAAAINLVNDLDLEVNDGRRTYLGNVFRSGHSVTGGTADSRNNVEQVLLPSPRAGNYTVTVRPRKIADGPQNFALVIRGPLR